MSRLFIALKIPENILDEIIHIRKSIYESGEFRKWESKEKLHVTLKFLGETNKQSEITNELDKVIKNFSEFECRLGNFGVIYRENIPSIIWASIKQNDSLSLVQSIIDDSMTKLGFERERRKFRPHITVLRNKSRNELDLLERFKGYDLSNFSFTASHIHLIESKLHSTGSVYKTIEKYELNKLEE